VAYTSRYDNVLLASYLWDAHVTELGVPTARMENHGIQMAYVWLERVGVERFRSRRLFVEDHHTVIYSLSEQSNIIMAVYESGKRERQESRSINEESSFRIN